MHRNRQHVEWQRQWLAVEVTARQDIAILHDEERVVGDGAVFGLDRTLDVDQRLADRTQHLWDAAQRVGILHAFAVGMTLAHRRAIHQLEQARRDCLLLGTVTQGVESRIKRSRRPKQRVDRHCRRNLRGGEEPFGIRKCQRSNRRHQMSPVEQRQSLFRAERNRRHTNRAERLSTWHANSARRNCLALANQGER